MLATTGALAGLLFGLGVPAKAAEPASPAQSVAKLRSYAQQLGTTPAASLKGAVQVAEADSLFGALREKANPGAAPMAKPARKHHAGGPPPQAKYVGDKVCLGCHTSQAKAFSKTMMGRLEKQGKITCETCHGPGSEHARLGGGRGVGGIISFRPNDLNRTAAQDNSICLGCHKRGDRTNWHGSIHQTRGLYCSNCHTIMKNVSRKNNLKTAWQPATCFQCHKDRQAQLYRSSHMPMRPDEGKIVCSDCHNPHGSYTKDLLRGDSINQVCYKCHAEKRGPFLWEHSPVRENCDNCHNPHGSVNQFSLRMSRPRLCFQCHGFGHGQTNGPGSAFTMNRSCQNCHTAIHGSNAPAGFYLQR